MHALRWFPKTLALVTALLVSSCGEPTLDDTNGDVCAEGSLGCPCAAGDVCGTSTRGEALVCVDDACEAPSCATGSTGCACRAGTMCDDPAAGCVDRVCKPVGCRAGELHCDCLVGSCGPGLYCDTSLGGGTCVDDEGFPGGECPDNGLCHAQSRCDRNTGTCVHCEPGSQGCVPDRGACNAGLFRFAGRCLPRNEIPPEAPECYTPCLDDVITDDGVRECDADGFIAGCLPGKACDQGTCVPSGEARIACASNGECPSHQACLSDGHCYSNCASDMDCPDGLSCHDHVCRVPCMQSASAARACPEGLTCDTEDGRNGVCMPVAAPPEEGEAAVIPRATFGVSPTSLAFTALSARSEAAPTELSLTTDSTVAERLEIRKLRHQAFDRAGAPIPESEDPRSTSSPLWFVSLSAQGGTQLLGGGVAVTLGSGCGASCPKVRVRLSAAVPSTWSRWEGELEVRHPIMGAQIVRLSYRASVSGRWVGTMYYFASFPDTGIPGWLANKNDAENVGNGLIRQWTTYRTGRFDRFEKFASIFNATKLESWRWPTVMEACRAAHANALRPNPACFLYDAGALAGTPLLYVDNPTNEPIPTGATEYPVALNLRGEVDVDGKYTLAGVIDSDVALHYGGRPAITLGFATPPDGAGACDPRMPNECATFLTSMSALASVGGRARPDEDGNCLPGFERVRVPWLVPGFGRGITLGERVECRETRLPTTGTAQRNANLTVGNPVPDGQPITRALQLLDGVMIDQRHMFVLFEERFTTSLATDPVSTYGAMTLDLSDEVVSEDELTPAPSAAVTPRVVDATALARASCEPAIARARSAAPGMAIPSDLAQLASVMLTGRLPTSGTIPAANVHYLCVDNGLFDGGAEYRGSPSDPRVACPIESNVRFFVLRDGTTQAQIADLPCQDDGTCGAQLEAWRGSNRNLELDPRWACQQGVSFCSANRFDLEDKKDFFESGTAAFSHIETAVADAFRYKLQFQSQQGGAVGFAPERCVGSGATTPYCYDAEAIERLADRVDCLLSIYAATPDPAHLGAGFTQLRSFLSSSVSVYPGVGAGAVPEGDGFEHLYAELLVMLGDESMTDAISSRFDLAATNGASFMGSRFELNGINLSGVAGFELRALYQAVQYYELVTDRFFTKVAPVLFAALDRGDIGNAGVAVMSPSVVTSYLDRLIVDSTKKAEAWNQIALRYQSLNEIATARAVLARAYMGAYLESALLTRLMLGISTQTQLTDRAGLLTQIERAQRQYQASLSSMREVHSSLAEGNDRFGFSPDYIPFPAVDDNDSRFSNAFEAVLGLARLRTDTARRNEDEAIASTRSFETDAASFQAELVRIALNHEQRLGEICGSFVGRDGRIYPATTRNAPQSDLTAMMGNPCGRTQSGEIFQQYGQLELLRNDVHENYLKTRRLWARLADEQWRVNAQCGRIIDLAGIQIREMSNRRDLRALQSTLEYEVGLAERTVNHLAQVLQFTKCNPLDPAGCIDSAIDTSTYTAAAVVSEVAIAGLTTGIIVTQSSIADSEIRQFSAETTSQCDALRIDHHVYVNEIYRQGEELLHEANQLNVRASLIGSEISRLGMEAQRLEQSQRESERLAINVESERNDPNVRVYANTSVLNADRSFYRALEYAHRATRLLEYYTSQSYPRRHELYLIRMTSRGEYNLDNYLDELEDTYESFRVEFRTRSRRALRLSLRDDILRIPTVDESNRQISINERARRMRDILKSDDRLDENGHRSIEFRTDFDMVAPCTFGHQIDYVQIDIQGADLGDLSANMMVWQEGTGVVRTPDGGKNFHLLPPALLVASVHLGHETSFDPAVYRNYGMRERPLVNTSWRLVFDHLHPQNRDLNIDNISDVYVYIYYTDFTGSGACR